MSVIIITIGILISISVYLILQKHLLQLLLGVALLSITVNMAIIVCGKTSSLTPAFIQPGIHEYANPVVQALVLTAIVIGFGFLAYLCTLLKIILPRKK